MMNDRIKTLEQISGLRVTYRKEIGKSGTVFEFHETDQIIKTIFTYPKAKLFAQGIEYGRKERSSP